MYKMCVTVTFCVIHKEEIMCVYIVGETQDRETMQWENVIADAYTQRLKRDRENSMETKVFEISERYLE